MSRTELIANRAMDRLLRAPSARNAASLPLDLDLERVLTGIVQVDDCYFLQSFAPERVPTSFGSLHDATGFECSVNSFHPEDYLPRDSSRRPAYLAGVTRRAASFLADQLRSTGAPSTFRVIGSVNGPASTLRFHAVRLEERWLARDIEKYQDAVFVLDVSPPD